MLSAASLRISRGHGREARATAREPWPNGGDESAPLARAKFAQPTPPGPWVRSAASSAGIMQPAALGVHDVHQRAHRAHYCSVDQIDHHHPGRGGARSGAAGAFCASLWRKRWAGAPCARARPPTGGMGRSCRVDRRLGVGDYFYSSGFAVADWQIWPSWPTQCARTFSPAREAGGCRAEHAGLDDELAVAAGRRCLPRVGVAGEVRGGRCR